MKVKIEFELDLSGTAYNIEDKKDLPECMANLSCWLGEVLRTSREQHVEFLFRAAQEAYSDEMKKSCLKIYADDIKIGTQIFDNYKVTGTMEDGKLFEFTHKEPGYVESLAIED